MSWSPTIFSKHWKQVTVLIVVMSVVGTFITKQPGAVVRVEAERRSRIAAAHNRSDRSANEAGHGRGRSVRPPGGTSDP